MFFTYIKQHSRDCEIQNNILQVQEKWYDIHLKETTNQTYTQNKGEEMGIEIGNNDLNEIMYAVIHEIAHMFNQHIGHGSEFVRLNKILL